MYQHVTIFELHRLESTSTKCLSYRSYGLTRKSFSCANYFSVSTSAGERQQTTPVDCAATMDFESEEFATRMSLQMRKSPYATYQRSTNCVSKGV
jgi:hypothetical protein